MVSAIQPFAAAIKHKDLALPSPHKDPSPPASSSARRNVALGVIGAFVLGALAVERPDKAAAVVTGGSRFVRPETREKIREEIEEFPIRDREPKQANGDEHLRFSKVVVRGRSSYSETILAVESLTHTSRDRYFILATSEPPPW
ncbi:hypothetical protein SELMODRAFT_402493 [Selaginella moellendorffii]|uniref:Uncharacterized protein n=1 Tax=Selaginella moellendorffii TaxID=88036 RepID=D8QQU3_SELML|nr:hypothetical protein SELMODRAFT_402493 [Selaginella moellendorffii]